MDISKRYDKSGHLTLEGMRAVLDEGGAVMYRGVTITDRAALPTKAQIAALSGKAEDKALAASEIQVQMAQMQAQLDALTAAPTTPGPQPDDAPSHEGTVVPDDQKPAESVTGDPGVLPGGNGKTAPKTDTVDGPDEAPATPSTGSKRP